VGYRWQRLVGKAWPDEGAGASWWKREKVSIVVAFREAPAGHKADASMMGLEQLVLIRERRGNVGYADSGTQQLLTFQGRCMQHLLDPVWPCVPHGLPRTPVRGGLTPGTCTLRSPPSSPCTNLHPPLFMFSRRCAALARCALPNQRQTNMLSPSLNKGVWACVNLWWRVHARVAQTIAPPSADAIAIADAIECI
jgi:hypothetical protein